MIGTLSFVGLLAPHLARQLGFRHALPQALSAVLLGAIIMVFADWAGRQIAFLRQVPAGLLATAIGAPVMIWLLWREGRSTA